MKNGQLLKCWHQQMKSNDAAQQNKAIGELYVYYHQTVLPRLKAKYKNFSATEIEDILSEAFETLIKEFSKLDLKYPSSVCAYVNTVIFNKVRYLSKNRFFIYQYRPSCSYDMVESNQETIIIREEEIALLKRAIDNLAPLQQIILFSWLEEDKPLKEIALENGNNYCYIRRQKMQAVRQIRQVFFKNR